MSSSIPMYSLSTLLQSLHAFSQSEHSLHQHRSILLSTNPSIPVLEQYMDVDRMMENMDRMGIVGDRQWIERVGREIIRIGIDRYIQPRDMYEVVSTSLDYKLCFLKLVQADSECMKKEEIAKGMSSDIRSSTSHRLLSPQQYFDDICKSSQSSAGLIKPQT